jgi:hypothetical protein
MLLKQEFKTLAGAQKRAAFENAHCDRRWVFSLVRCADGEPDSAKYDPAKFSTYTWRLGRAKR